MAGRLSRLWGEKIAFFLAAACGPRRYYGEDLKNQICAVEPLSEIFLLRAQRRQPGQTLDVRISFPSFNRAYDFYKSSEASQAEMTPTAEQPVFIILQTESSSGKKSERVIQCNT